MSPSDTRLSAFADSRRIASGAPLDVALTIHSALAADPNRSVLVFDDVTGRPVDLDLHGSEEDVRARYGAPAASTPPPAEVEPRKGPGRPRLGVVPKEVTLMPRHWAWLGAQRGGASATLRRLVDEARKIGAQHDEIRRAQDAAFRFMSAMGGDLPGYEEGLRALFAGDRDRFSTQLERWPPDIRDHTMALAASVFGPASPATDAE